MLFKTLKRSRKPTDATRSFNEIMKMAEDISNQNAAGLRQLVRALLMPLQAEHLLAVAEVEQHTAPTQLDSHSFFFPLGKVAQRMNFWVQPTPRIVLSLASDIVLPTPWERTRYAHALAHTGEGRARGPWRSDSNMLFRFGFRGVSASSDATGSTSST